MVVYVVATTVSPTYVQRGLCSLTALHYAFSLVEGRGVCASVCACAFVCSRTGISWLPLQCLIARCTYVCAFGTCALLHTPVERVPMLHTHTHTHTHTPRAQISGQGPIAPHLSKLYGIRNGIDADIWDPEDDPFLPMPYSADNCIQVRACMHVCVCVHCVHFLSLSCYVCACVCERACVCVCVCV